MAFMNIPLSLGYYPDESVNLVNLECLNLYPVTPKTQGTINTTALRSPSGISVFSEDEDVGECRGAIAMNGTLYAVIGSRFYIINSLGDRFTTGDPIPGSGRVQMANNGKVVTVIIPGTELGFFYDTGTGLFESIDDQVFLDYGNKLDVVYKDGYFIYLTAKEFFLSSLVVENNGKNFNALDYGTAELSNDDNIALFVVRNELYIAGKETIEVFQNTGASFPFARINGAAIDRGILSPNGVIPFQNTFLCIGAGKNEGASIWMGGTQVISNPAIDHIIQQASPDDLANTYTFKYSESGNFFSVFTIPNTITLVYDESQGTWHRRGEEKGIWRVFDMVQVYGRTLCFDNNSGVIGQLDANIRTEYGEIPLRRFNTGYIHKYGESFIVRNLELSTQYGTVGEVATPTDISMKVSMDGGINFGHPVTRRTGDRPSTETRTVWRNLGQYEYSLAFQFDITTDEDITITNLIGDIV